MDLKTVVTITGIRPDFIRMSQVFKKLDQHFRHILIHSGQHYDRMLSDVFFDELDIRKPDYNLEVGSNWDNPCDKISGIVSRTIDIFQREKINPDIILFLGDSHSVCASVELKKAGYKIGHIEAGMRSYDRRMAEEINRIVCDHVSDYLFVYHYDYAQQAISEGISREKIFIVGNTIVEVAKPIAEELKKKDKTFDFIMVDIHRPENFKYPERMQAICDYVNFMKSFFCVPARMLGFKRTIQAMEEYGTNKKSIEIVPLMSYKDFMEAQYNSVFIVSDSGTAQEEASLLGTPVVVPRDFTERPQSMKHNCSHMLDVMNDGSAYPRQEDTIMEIGGVKLRSNPGWSGRSGYWRKSIQFILDVQLPPVDDPSSGIDPSWLGDGQTSSRIIQILDDVL